MVEHKFIHKIDYAKLLMTLVILYLVLRGYTRVDELITIEKEKSNRDDDNDDELTEKKESLNNKSLTWDDIKDIEIPDCYEEFGGCLDRAEIILIT